MNTLTWADALTLWHKAAPARLAPTSVRTYADRLRVLARAHSVTPPEQLDGDVLAAWLLDPERPWSAETRRGYWNAAASLYAALVQAGRVEVSPLAGRTSPPAGVPKPRPTPPAVWRQAVAGADRTELLWLKLAGRHGMRRGEVAVVWPERDLVEDLDGQSLLVHGKGKRERLVPLTPDVARALRQLGPGYAFPGDDDGHVSPRWVGTRISRLMPEGWTMHTLRHMAATEWYELSGHDIRLVQELLGHASVVTTQRYTAVRDGKKRAVVLQAAA